ncbi:unnamed protein product [Paramecium primaurelia]|uniref:Uncharacterized protein n=1 Tax=Paramecium primaurelia TaxID=5886 RepID=A0A8S1QR80_PARPR|nr:unnamed protein product [Paramecium primaurelia]
MIACDKELKKNQRLKSTLKERIYLNVLIFNIKQLEELQKALHQLKSNVIQQLEYFIENANEWIKKNQIWGQAKLTYSFFDELEKLINQSKLDQSFQKSLFDQISQINQSQNQKIFKKLNLFKSFQETQKCEELLISLQNFKLIKENEILIDKNIILVRHKHHIYLIRESNHGTFNIMASLNCQNDKILGTMPNNGWFLVFLDSKYKKYQSYEILNK